MATNSTFSEGDLPTSSAEDRTRTVDTETPAAASSTIPPPATGDLLQNRFLLHECLASGPASRVFRALDQRRQAAGDSNPWVVLKVVTAAPGPEPRALVTLRREAAVSQGLEHPNLPWVRGLDQDGPHTFLCLAWLPGESLATLLDNRGPRPMTRTQTLNIVEGIGHALTYLHGLGITHADVKPGNILVSAEGHATLLDLGVALGPDADDRVSAHGYTPQYASPEVLNGALPTPADDLFSLACVTYRMLCGRRAFGEGNACEAAAAGARPERPDNLSATEWQALDRALAYARAGRQRDVQSFLTQLTGLPDEPAAVTDRVADRVPDPVAPRPPGTALPAATSTWNLRRWWPAAALVAGALAIASFFLNPQPKTPPAVAAPHAVAGPVQRAAPVVPVAAKRASGNNAGSVAVRPELTAVDPGTPPETETPGTEPPAAELLAEVPAATTATMPEGALPDTTAPPAVGEPRVSFSRLKVRRYVEPRYPRNALDRRVAGWVEVAFTVDASGRTRDVRVINADPPGIFENAALAAVNRWRFDTEGSTAGPAPVHSGIRLRFQPQ